MLHTRITYKYDYGKNSEDMPQPSHFSRHFRRRMVGSVGFNNGIGSKTSLTRSRGIRQMKLVDFSRRRSYGGRHFYCTTFSQFFSRTSITYWHRFLFRTVKCNKNSGGRDNVRRRAGAARETLPSALC